MAGALAVQEGLWVTEQVVVDLAQDLTRFGLLERGRRRRHVLGDPPPAQWQIAPPPVGLPLRVHPAARFTCDAVGTCCRSGYVIPLDRPAKDRVVVAAQRLGLDTDAVVLLPTRAGQRWTYALDNDPRCPFLSSQSTCAIHGRAAQPGACRVFPFTFIRVGREVHGSVAHRCGCGTLGRGELLSQQRPKLRRRMKLGPVPRLPARARIDDHRWAGLDVARAMADVSLERTSARELVSRAYGVLEPPAARSPGRTLSGLRRRLLSFIDPDDGILRAAIGGTPHPQQHAVVRDLRRANLDRPRRSVEREVARFVRDHLFGLRPYQHPSLARGLFALSFAVADILSDSERTHTEARTRIMLWEDAFVSPALRAVLGPDGPLASELADVGRVRAWSERLMGS